MSSMHDRIMSHEFQNEIDRPDWSRNQRLADPVSYRYAMNRYHKGESEAIGRFRDAALEDVGLASHPNAGKIFDYAWEQGHREGLCGVYDTLTYLADLFFVDGKLLNAHKGDA